MARRGRRGTWGVGPLDNDGAADLLGAPIIPARAAAIFGDVGELDVGSPNPEVIKEARAFVAHPAGWKMHRKDDYTLLRASAYILNRWGLLTPAEAQHVADELQKAVDNPEPFEGWKGPREARRALQKDVAEYRRLAQGGRRAPRRRPGLIQRLPTMPTGQRAAARSTKHLALWRAEMPDAYGKPALWYVLYMKDALPWAWKNAHPNAWMGPGMQVMLAQTDLGATGKAVMLLQRRDSFASRSGVPSPQDWEMTEIAAVEGHGPMLFNLVLADINPLGLYPDTSSLSPQAKRFLAASRRTGRYDLEPFTSRMLGRNRTTASVYRLKKGPLKTERAKLRKLLAAHDEAVEAIPWDSLQYNEDLPEDREGLTRENLDAWLKAAHNEWFRMRYHGSGRGRGRG